ncbi:MAG: threonylcarbamoyl-AMP synthase [Candidatus Magasanikbacteria bacterium]|nr:threonylcarbamoyl-AMP synthase [Candidatus Magasanikbacteria bacterium]
MKMIKQDEIKINEVVRAIKDGATIVYPTETTYGLGCDATNKEAVKKIFSIKKRQKHKPVLVIMSDLNMVMTYVGWSAELEELASKYWPGPLTVVSELSEGVDLPEGVVGKDNTLAFRVTKHPLVSDIIKELGKPLVSTSANISSMASPYDVAAVKDMFKDADQKPDLIIDAGTLPHHLPSTIVKLQNGSKEVLRQGELIIDHND